MFSYKYNGDRDILKNARINKRKPVAVHACRDCGSTEDVRPIGPNTYLCKACLLKPVKGFDKNSKPFGYTFLNKNVSLEQNGQAEEHKGDA